MRRYQDGFDTGGPSLAKRCKAKTWVCPPPTKTTLAPIIFLPYDKTGVANQWYSDFYYFNK